MTKIGKIFRLKIFSNLFTLIYILIYFINFIKSLDLKEIGDNALQNLFQPTQPIQYFPILKKPQRLDPTTKNNNAYTYVQISAALTSVSPCIFRWWRFFVHHQIVCNLCRHPSKITVFLCFVTSKKLVSCGVHLHTQKHSHIHKPKCVWSHVCWLIRDH